MDMGWKQGKSRKCLLTTLKSYPYPRWWFPVWDLTLKLKNEGRAEEEEGRMGGGVRRGGGVIIVVSENRPALQEQYPDIHSLFKSVSDAAIRGRPTAGTIIQKRWGWSRGSGFSICLLKKWHPLHNPRRQAADWPPAWSWVGPAFWEEGICVYSTWSVRGIRRLGTVSLSAHKKTYILQNPQMNI